MAAAIGFSRFISGQCLSSKERSKQTISITPVSKTILRPVKIKTGPQIYTKRATKRKPHKLYVAPRSSLNFDTSSFSPAETIMQFYSYINEKNLTQLEKLIAEDCYFEDYSFPKPFQGKKEVMHFLEQLTTCLGDYKNMQFNVDLISVGNDYTAAVNWHIDWKRIQVPFTRGCSYFSLSENDDKLVIKKAQVLVESPIKLGVVALIKQQMVGESSKNQFYNQAIFKTVSSLFDAFPAATEWFLKSPHTIFRLLLKAYSICIQPMISPFLASYIKLLNLAACILSTTLKILYYLSKIFHM